MTEMIRVRPARARLREFARWATAQTPKIGTVGLGEFGVPPELFVQAPEELLIGATVDGHPYVSPEEDAERGRPAPGARLLDCGLCYEEDGQEVHPHPECPRGAPAGDLLGVATPEALTGPSDLKADAAGGGDGSDRSDPGPDYAPLEDAPQDGDEGEGGPYPCDQCAREFSTERGRDSHRRQVHRED